jgi:putative tricarboxylic transport membrane protein
MTSTRRDILGLIAGTAAAGVGLRANPAGAQALQRLNILVPSGPGGGWDQTGRTMEFALRTSGAIREFRYEHVAGGSGALGLSRFLSARRGQGDALMVSGMVMVGALAANRSPVKLLDAIPLARLTGEFEVVVVPAASPLTSMAGLIARLKANPGAVSWAGGAAGGSDHILAGMIAKFAGVDPRRLAYVAYAGGGQAQAAVLGNQVTCAVNGYAEMSEQIRAGKLRALALSSDVRQPGINIPTLKEQGVDVELFNWRGVFGAPGISEVQKNALLALIDAMAKGPIWRAELQKKNWTDIYLSGDAFARYLRDETARITTVVSDLGLAG